MLELLFSEYRPYLQDVLAWIVCIAALLWGGAPERIVAATWLLLFETGEVIYTKLLGESWQLASVDWYFAGIDLLAVVIMIATALYANRNYTLWIAAMQLLSFVAHISRGLIDAISPITYAIMVIAPGWLMLVFLAAGLVRHIRRKRKYGDYRDWRVRMPISADGPVSERLFPDWLQSNRKTWRDELK